MSWFARSLLVCCLVPLVPAGGAGGDGPVSMSDKELQALWDDLGGDDAQKAYQSLWRLVGAPKQTVVLFKERLRPVPLPTAEEQKEILGLIADLDNPRFPVRNKAMQQLQKLGDLAVPVLRQTKKDKLPLEAQRRIDELLARMDSPVLTGAALQRLRAIEVLEYIATAEARQVLQAMAGGAPEHRLTLEARKSLDRLGKRN
jgi:alkylation response protein AidB-like acyl-CoA dehydrogenase